MSLSNEIGQFEFPGWIGGINRDMDQFKVPVEESPDALDVDFDLGGSVSRRLGYTSYLTWAETPWRLNQWRGVLLGVSSDGSVFNESGGAMTDSTFSLAAPSDDRTWQVPVASMNDAIYMTQCDSVTPLKWDGSSWTQVTATTFDGTASRFPRARALVHLHERIFAGNVLDGATAHPSRLYFSNALDPETWDALDYIEVAPDDGTEITALRAYGDGILVFKERSLYLLSGVDDDSFTLYPVDPEVGSAAPDTIVVEGGVVIFFDPNRGVLAFNGEGFQPLDERINRYLLDNINFTYAYKAHAKAYRNRYYLTVPWEAGTSNTRTFVLDLRTGAWTEYSWASPALTVASDMLYGCPEDGVFDMQSGADDNGTAISSYWRTAWIKPAGFGSKHRARRMDMSASLDGATTLTVDMRRDMDSDTYRSQEFDLSPGGSLWGTFTWGDDDWGTGSEEVLVKASGWGDRWQTAQFTFSSEDGYSLSGLRLHISVHPRQRGEL